MFRVHAGVGLFAADDAIAKAAGVNINLWRSRCASGSSVMNLCGIMPRIWVKMTRS